jgi:CubicO group peptidase (beta-lactamase class C family)
MMRTIACFLMVLSLGFTVSAQVPSSSIDSLFSRFDPRDPGCAVAVIKDGNVVFENGYGVAELRTQEKIGPETNFRLASLTKQFTAMAIMLLVHDGKLRYDDRLTEVLPGFPAYGKRITVRQMLNHTSGLIDYEDIMAKQYPGVPDGKIPQIHDTGVLDLLKHQTTTRFAPGTRWEYSNSGYVLLGLVVQQRSGMSFGDFLRKRIFAPLGMTHTILYEKGKNEVTHRAYGHTLEAGVWRETDQSSTSATLGDGGVYSSLEDLAKWDRALAEHTLLSEKEMQPALTAATDPHGAPLRKLDRSLAPLYGFGWFLDAYRGHRRYWHYGETVAFRTAIVRFPDQRLTVIVLANRLELNAPALAENIADLYLAKN